jgi:AAA domain
MFFLQSQHRRIPPLPATMPDASLSLFQDLHDLRPRLRQAYNETSSSKAIAGIVLVTGRWQKPPPIWQRTKDDDVDDSMLQRLAAEALVGIHEQQALQVFSARICVNDEKMEQSQEDLEFALQHLHIIVSSSSSRRRTMRTLPSTLPALALVYQNRTMEQSEWIFLDTMISPADLYRVLVSADDHDTSSTNNSRSVELYRRLLLRPIVAVVNRELLSTNVLLDPTVPFLAKSAALRLFVAGDRSSVGKSSVCLGLLGNWYQQDDKNDDILNQQTHNKNIAYIKPATQSESKQLIEMYCDTIGLECVPVGPLVYYRGFTRAYLAGQTSDSNQLLADCAYAVDLVARGKDLVLIDGVGFPAVGSICGTSNAQVASACQADAILLVGGPGVGAAVDAYHLNATYFTAVAPHIPILGAIFNKLPTSGYYNVNDCRDQVTSYFDQYHLPPPQQQPQQQQQRPFGFVPVSETLQHGLTRVDEFLQLFAAHVDVDGILVALTRAAAVTSTTTRGQDSAATATVPAPPVRDPKRRKGLTLMTAISTTMPMTRQEIEVAAIQAGAAPSA